MVVNYTPLSATFIDGRLIGSHGVQDKSAKTFVYKAGLNEVEFCAKKIFNDVLPKGRLWEAHGVVGTPDYSLSMGAGDILAQLLAYFEYLRKELDIDATEDLIAEWEESCGLPDPCTMGNFTTIEQRRELVKIHLAKKTTVTDSEFESLVKKLTGFDVIVVPRRDYANYLNGMFDGQSNFDSAPFSNDKTDRFTFDVFVNYTEENYLSGDFQLDGSYFFDGSMKPLIVECLIEKLKPSNSRAVYHYSETQYQQVKDSML